MDHWQSIAAIVATLLSAAGAGAAKIISANASLWKELWEAEREDRVRLEDRLDSFYEEGRTLAIEREAQNTALKREVEELRSVIAAKGIPPHASTPGQD